MDDLWRAVDNTALHTLGRLSNWLAQRAVTAPTLCPWGFESLPAHGGKILVRIQAPLRRGSSTGRAFLILGGVAKVDCNRLLPGPNAGSNPVTSTRKIMWENW